MLVRNRRCRFVQALLHSAAISDGAPEIVALIAYSTQRSAPSRETQLAEWLIENRCAAENALQFL